MKPTLIASVLALFFGSVVQAAPAPVPAPQLGGSLLSGLTAGLPLIGGVAGAGGGNDSADVDDATTR